MTGVEVPIVQGRRAAATMNDVAERAGVSLKTVSNVVNDHPHIRPATRAKVEAAIEELGYRLNASARNLRRGRTGVIGLAVPELGIPYFAELAGSVVGAAEERGLSVMIELTGGERDREIALLHGPQNGLRDGLIYSPLGMGDEETDRDLLAVDYPLVLLGERIFGGPVDHVTMSNVEGPRAATRFLIERGARRIVALGTHPGEVVGSAGLRLDGHELGLADAGRVPIPELQLVAGPWHRMPDFAGKIAIAPAPVVDDAVVDSVGGGGTGTAVVAGKDNEELAAEFVAWAKLSDVGNVEIWNVLGFDPLNTSVWHDESVTHNPDNAFVQYFQNNPFDALLEIEDSIGNLESFSNPSMPSVNNLLNTTTFNDIFESDVPIADALSQAQSDLKNELGE